MMPTWSSNWAQTKRLKAERVTSLELPVSLRRVSGWLVANGERIQPTDQPIGAEAACDNHDEPEREERVQGDFLPPWDCVVPCDDARERHGVDVADHGADAGDGVDGGGVEASVPVRENVIDVEGSPVGLGRRAVDQQHDAESNGIRNGKADSNPHEPGPAP
jgi:hypothetical protein